MADTTKCVDFCPQRFRPNFCKTCCKTKAEHATTPMQDLALRASLPAAIAPINPNNVPIGLSNSMQAAPLRRPSERKKSSMSKSKPQTSGNPQLKRRLSIVNRNNRISKQMQTGFIAKQQQKNEIPNANKFFVTALRGLLSEGIGLSHNETEDLVRRVMGSNVVKDDADVPQVLLSDKKTKYLNKFIATATSFMEEQQTLKQIITVQSLARRYLVSKRFGSMTPEAVAMMKKRNQIYIDLVRTEREFVDSTDHLISNYVVRIRQSDVVGPPECASIFSNIETVADEHRSLLRRIEAASDDWPFIKSIGAIFLDIKSLLNAISVYVSNFKNAMNEIERITAENPRFQAFCLVILLFLN